MILKNMVRRSFRVRQAAREAEEGLRPANVCRDLLTVFGATEGSRHATTPDSRGRELTRAWLERVVREDPDPETFERWLREGVAAGAHHGISDAVAMDLLLEWRLAQTLQPFRDWVDGRPSSPAGQDIGGPLRIL